MAKALSNIILCDDHAISLVGIETLLRRHLPEPLSIRQATNGEHALQLFEQSPPDLLIVDLAMSGMSGLELISEARSRSENCRIMVLSGSDNAHDFLRAKQRGADALLRKIFTGPHLLEALRFLQTGTKGCYSDLSVQQMLGQNKEKPLARREYEVLELMTRGLTSQEIADHLDCSLTTVKTYRLRIMNKTGARNAAEMTAWFLKGHGKAHLGSPTELGGDLKTPTMKSDEMPNDRHPDPVTRNRR